MADVKWIKITTDIFDDEKIILIESLPDAYAIITCWFKLLCLAGKQNNNGVFLMGRMPYTDKMLATIFRMKEPTVTMALKTFESFGMIEIIDNVITIPKWNKHQTLDAYEKKKERDRLYQAERRAHQRALVSKAFQESSDKSSDVAFSEEEKEERKRISFNQSLGFDDEKNDDYEASNSAKREYMGGELGKGVVMLSEDENEDLLDKLSFDEYNKYIKIVAEKELKGHHYKKKTHYQAILDMAMSDRKKARR